MSGTTKENFPIAIYARVSTDHQDTENQLSELRDFVDRSGWQTFKEYVDSGYSGKDTKRPAFSEMMEHAKEKRFRAVLVWKLDRLSRSLKDLVLTIEELGSLGIDFVSYSNHIDTTTPAGKLLFQVMGAVAEFEREIIRERVKLGLRNAIKKGKRLGRPCVNPKLIEEARQLRKSGMSFRNISAKLGVDHSTLVKRIKAI
ncbi:MAG: recombinase family protein [Candidatus Aminicenantes bacterium]|nr:recombinase family protein [Candidatus Aminicenantes bacterium]